MEKISSPTAVAGAHNIKQNESSQQKIGARFKSHPRQGLQKH